MRQLLSFLVALPLWVLGQDSQNALLWRISRPEGGPPSYLLGTVHSRDARAYAASVATSSRRPTSTVAMRSGSAGLRG